MIQLNIHCFCANIMSSSSDNNGKAHLKHQGGNTGFLGHKCDTTTLVAPTKSTEESTRTDRKRARPENRKGEDSGQAKRKESDQPHDNDDKKEGFSTLREANLEEIADVESSIPTKITNKKLDDERNELRKIVLEKNSSSQQINQNVRKHGIQDKFDTSINEKKIKFQTYAPCNLSQQRLSLSNCKMSRQ